MIIFFAGADASSFRKILLEKKVNGVLFSQYYSHDKSKDFFRDFIDYGAKVFMDSGGFTARIRGVPLKIEDYAEFLKKHKNGWTYCANLDVMNPDETLKNQEYLEKQGIKAIPVFHYSEVKLKRKDLMEYYCKNYPYVAIGGVAATVRSSIIKKRYFDFCFSLAMKYKTKLHGFGVMDLESLYNYPWYSCDATSWLAGAKFARVYRFKHGKLLAANARLKMDLKGGDLLKFSNPLQYIDGSSLKYKRRCRQNVEAFIQLENFITKLWEKRGVVWKNKN